MIRLPEITKENAEKFYQDTYPSMIKLLLNYKQVAIFKDIVDYCSMDGELDNQKISPHITIEFKVNNHILYFIRL